MMIVMKEGASDGQIQAIVDRVTAAGAQAHVSRGEFVTVIGAIGDDREMIAQLDLAGQDGVERIVELPHDNESRILMNKTAAAIAKDLDLLRDLGLI